ncbi:hypothetical protein GCM10023189_37820 [Nibrella saemangeumensis]|uniref:Uncharacterized protein n=1 Tax=Nibrella saemangeumensis TaxID=1084526 RepID=A0ABP8N5U4_9BACT
MRRNDERKRGDRLADCRGPWWPMEKEAAIAKLGRRRAPPRGEDELRLCVRCGTQSEKGVPDD